MSSELLATIVLGLLAAGFAGAELMKPPRWLRWILGLLSATCFIAALVLLVSFAPFKLHSPIVVHFQSPLEFPLPKRCQLTASAESHLVARLYVRNSEHLLVEPGMKTLMRPQFEDLFYEWKVSIKPDETTPNVFLAVDHLKQNDVVSVTPEDGRISAATPKWFSGFTEPASRKPDYYARTINFDRLSKDQPAMVSIRRELKFPAIDEVDIIRLADVRSVPCLIHIIQQDATINSNSLNHQATMLTRPPGVSTLKVDVGDVPLDQFEMTAEMICANDACTAMTFKNMVVHLGTPLNQVPP